MSWHTKISGTAAAILKELATYPNVLAKQDVDGGTPPDVLARHQVQFARSASIARAILEGGGDVETARYSVELGGTVSTNEAGDLYDASHTMNVQSLGDEPEPEAGVPLVELH